jgi:hypothetical protein
LLDGLNVDAGLVEAGQPLADIALVNDVHWFVANSKPAAMNGSITRHFFLAGNRRRPLHGHARSHRPADVHHTRIRSYFAATGFTCALTVRGFEAVKAIT